MPFRVASALYTNLRSPTVYAAFTAGVASAEDRLSIPIEPRWRADLDALREDCLSYDACFPVGLVVTSPTEEHTSTTDEVTLTVEHALSAGTVQNSADILLVALPYDLLASRRFFDSRVPREMLDRVVVDGAQDIEQFSKIVEFQLVSAGKERLPLADTLDNAQSVALDEPLSAGHRSSPVSYIPFYGSLS